MTVVTDEMGADKVANGLKTCHFSIFRLTYKSATKSRPTFVVLYSVSLRVCVCVRPSSSWFYSWLNCIICSIQAKSQFYCLTFGTQGINITWRHNSEQKDLRALIPSLLWAPATRSGSEGHSESLWDNLWCLPIVRQKKKAAALQSVTRGRAHWEPRWRGGLITNPLHHTLNGQQSIFISTDRKSFWTNDKTTQYIRFITQNIYIYCNCSNFTFDTVTSYILF